MEKLSLRSYNKMISTLIDEGRTDEAVSHCKHILLTYPKYLDTYRLLGKAYLESNRYADALDIFQRILAVTPDDFLTNAGMSLIREEEGDQRAAIWHMERAFEVAPSNPAIQEELKILYGKRDGTKPDKLHLTRGALCWMYARGNQNRQAVAEIKSILSQSHGRPDLEVLLADTLVKLNQKTEAILLCNNLLQKYPYCMKANQILAALTGPKEPGQPNIYQDRLIELDPYIAYLSSVNRDLDSVPDDSIKIDPLAGTPTNQQMVQADLSFQDKPEVKAETPEQTNTDDINIPEFEENTPSIADTQPIPMDDPGIISGEGIPDWLSDTESTSGLGTLDRVSPVETSEPEPKDHRAEDINNIQETKLPSTETASEFQVPDSISGISLETDQGINDAPSPLGDDELVFPRENLGEEQTGISGIDGTKKSGEVFLEEENINTGPDTPTWLLNLFNEDTPRQDETSSPHEEAGSWLPESTLNNYLLGADEAIQTQPQANQVSQISEESDQTSPVDDEGRREVLTDQAQDLSLPDSDQTSLPDDLAENSQSTNNEHHIFSFENSESSSIEEEFEIPDWLKQINGDSETYAESIEINSVVEPTDLLTDQSLETLDDLPLRDSSPISPSPEWQPEIHESVTPGNMEDIPVIDGSVIQDSIADTPVEDNQATIDDISVENTDQVFKDEPHIEVQDSVSADLPENHSDIPGESEYSNYEQSVDIQSFKEKIRDGNQIEQIVEELIALTDIFPTKPDPWFLLGDAYREQGELHKAISAYAKAGTLLE